MLIAKTPAFYIKQTCFDDMCLILWRGQGVLASACFRLRTASAVTDQEGQIGRPVPLWRTTNSSSHKNFRRTMHHKLRSELEAKYN